MNKDDIIRMAKEAGGYPTAPTDRALLLFSESHLERFAAMIAAVEREACAKICDDFADTNSGPDGIMLDYHSYLIRQRGQA